MTVCPFATWRPVQNHGSRMSAQLGLVLHVQEGNGGLSGWFNNPSSGASSTYWASKSGTLEQYVECEVTAWAQASGNSTYQSVETEGYHTEPLTPPQEQILARLYAWGATTFGWPNALAETPGQAGFGWHGMGGSAWGGHTGCPGDLRKPRRQPILDAAFGAAPPTPEEDDLTPEQDQILRWTYNMVLTGVGHWDGQTPNDVSWLWERLVNGQPELVETQFGALMTLDKLLRDANNRLVDITNRLDALETKS